MVLAVTATLIMQGDARQLPLPDASVDAIVTDPPYGLEFMGKAWDRPWAVNATARVGFEGREDNLTLPSHRDSRNANCTACGGRQRGAKRCACAKPAWDRHPKEDMLAFQLWSQEWAEEALRVLKPGGHLLAFGGTRTFHRQAVAIEDAGFEVRDCLSWLYGQGFPKSLDVSKAIDKAAGAERTATEDAARWEGWGTALKPAWEPILLARKPLVGTVASNVLAHGTGALNVDGCRIAGNMDGGWGGRQSTDLGYHGGAAADGSYATSQHEGGRWPANVALDETAASILDTQTGNVGGGFGVRGSGAGSGIYDHGSGNGYRPAVTGQTVGYGDSGGASRFFYVAKPSKAERNAGLAELPEVAVRTYEGGPVVSADHPGTAPGGRKVAQNHHPTVKPVALMRWLVRMVTPPGGVVLDPFMGSGTTLEAATLEGFHGIGVELTAEYLPLAQGRTARPLQPGLFA